MLLRSGVTSARPMPGVPRSSWPMRAMTTLNRSRTNCGIPSECDPELSTTSTVQMLPSRWITRWPFTGSYKPSIPCNRRHDLCCAGKIDCAPMIETLIDIRIVTIRDNYVATEIVIAIRPYGVLSKPDRRSRRTAKMLFSTGPLHQLAYFCHRSEDGIAPFRKLDPCVPSGLRKKIAWAE